MTPDGWVDEPALVACERVGRVPTVPRSQYKAQGSIPIVDQGRSLVAGFTDDDSMQYTGELPVILFGDHTREWKFLNFSFAAGADGTQLLRGRPGTDQRFIYYALKALPLKSLGYSRHFKLLKELSITVPPLPEQRKIASILASMDDAIEATQAVIDQLGVVKRALMDELLTRGLPGRHKKFNQTEIGEVPEGWEVVRLADVANIVRGSTPRPAKDPRYFGGNAAPWITVGELSKDDWPYLNEVATGLTEEGRSRSRLLEAGTVVLSNSGFGCGVPKILGLSGCANDGIAAFLELRRLFPVFLYYSLFSMIEFLRHSVARGVDQPNLNTALIGELRLRCPPQDEQRVIVEGLLAVDRRLRAERESATSLASTKAALASVLLTGEVRVKPHEDPA